MELMQLIAALESILERGIEVRPLYPGMKNGSIMEGCTITLADDARSEAHKAQRSFVPLPEESSTVRRSW